MKTILISLVILFVVVKIYFFILKMYRKREAFRINKILKIDFINQPVSSIENAITKNSFFENLIKKETDGDFTYIYTSSPSQKTISIYQFLKNHCTSFYIQSFEEKYSLPYWNYIKEYTAQERLHENDHVGLALYTVNKFLEPFEDSAEEFEKELEFYFKTHYLIGLNRYISINLDNPTYSRSNYPLYLYLCSNNLQLMELFRMRLETESEFLMPFIVDYKALQKRMNKG